MEPALLARDAFRAAVLARDANRCVLCGEPAQDAHHILERRLWQDGGYYLENGASVCGRCHLRCERTEVSVEELREAAGIRRAILPAHLYDDQAYDKWGNPVLPGGRRLKGDLFFDGSVQRALSLGRALPLFTPYVKYPRTYHLPWSPGVGKDDRVMESDACFPGREVVVTEKMDGESTTMYRDHIHARSIDSGSHASRGWVKAFHAEISAEIPEGWRVCGENLFAIHSIRYGSLPSYFLGFSVWDERNRCLPWDHSLEWFALLGVVPVRTLWRGTYDREEIRKACETALDPSRQEGYVVRVADGFPYGAFRDSVGKFVRENHVRTTRHWMAGQRVEKNGLAAP